MVNDSPPPGHLPDETLAGYIDGSLSPSTRSSVEAHLADCATCRAEFVAASRLADAAPPPKRQRIPTVALAVLAAGLVIAVVGRNAGKPAQDPIRSSGDSSASARSVLTVVSPLRGALATPASIRFVWRPAATIVEYTVTVQDRDGRVRWTTSTSDTSVALPDSVIVVPGSVLHWYVDGLRADGRSVGTGRQQLTVR